MAAGRRRQHRRAAPGRGAGRRHPRRRGDLPGDARRDRVPRRPSRSTRRARPSRSRSGRRWRRGPSSASTLRSGRRTPLVGRERGAGACSGRARRARRERTPQLVTLVGVPGSARAGSSRARVRAGRRPELVSWRQGRSLPYGEGVDLLGARRDGQGAGRRSSRPTTPTTPRRSCARPSRALIADAGRGALGRAHLRPLVGLGAERGAGGRRERGVRRLAPLLRGARRAAARSCSSSRTCTGPTTACSTSSTSSSTGRPACRCSWSRTARPELLERRPGWGGGKRERDHALALAALRRADTRGCSAALLEQRRAPGRRAGRAARARRRQPAVRRGVRADADRPRPDAAADRDGRRCRCPRPCRGSSRRGSTRSRAEEKALLQDAAVVGHSLLAGRAGRARRRAQRELGGAPARARAQGVRAPRARAPPWRARDAVRVLARARPRRRLRPDPARRRAEKHRRAAEWIESLGADRAEDRAELLAHHYLARARVRARGGPRHGGARAAARGSRSATAGDRALALHALRRGGAASTREALELWPEDDPDRPRAALPPRPRAAPVERAGRRAGAEARDALLAPANASSPPRPRSRSRTIAWTHGQQRRRARSARPRPRPARRLAADRPRRRYVRQPLRGFLMARRPGGARRSGSAARRSRWPRASGSTTSSRAPSSASASRARRSADAAGLHDLARSLEFAERTGPAEVARSHFNLGEHVREPRRPRARVRPLRRGAEAARKLGDPRSRAGSRPRAATSATGAGSGTRRSRRPSGRPPGGRGSRRRSRRGLHLPGARRISTERRPSPRVRWRSPARPRRPRRSCRRWPRCEDGRGSRR